MCLQDTITMLRQMGENKLASIAEDEQANRQEWLKSMEHFDPRLIELADRATHRRRQEFDDRLAHMTAELLITKEGLRMFAEGKMSAEKYEKIIAMFGNDPDVLFGLTADFDVYGDNPPPHVVEAKAAQEALDELLDGADFSTLEGTREFLERVMNKGKERE